MNELVELLDELQKKQRQTPFCVKNCFRQGKSESNPRILRNLPCLWRFHL